MKTTMIKTAFILAMLASGGAITLAAGNGSSFGNSDNYFNKADDAESKKPQTIYSWIQRNMPCPEFVESDEENRVELWLNITDDQKIVVLKTKSDTQRLSDFVKAKLNGRICPNAEAGGQYHFAINFKRIG